MTIRVMIKNDEPAGATSTLKVTVVTVGDLAGHGEQRKLLAAQEAVEVHVHKGSFMMVEEMTAEPLPEPGKTALNQASTNQAGA